MLEAKPKNNVTSIKKIDARGLSTQELNTLLREATTNGIEKIEIQNVCGQRYIGTDLCKKVDIEIFGTPGNDLGSFMNGPRITVHGNAQDGTGNTMDDGEIVIHGHAGDIAGLSCRSGKIFVRDYVGYRAGIHMKEYGEKKSILVIGGTAQDFLAEYMAGGVIVLLGLDLQEGETHHANYIGTGMHGGTIYLTGKVNEYQLGKEVGISELDQNDHEILNKLVTEFAAHFGYDAGEIMKKQFIKLFPLYLRPYGRLYAY
jgi:glutamate synthase domain-containing protein 3